MAPIQFDPDFASPSDWAAMYRQLGAQVVPAKMPKEDKAWKRPVIKWREYEGHLTDDDTFAGWYGSEGEFRHRENMGIITGAASGNIWVLDIDSHNHPQAMKWLQALIDEWNDGIPLRTATQRTGGGGIQIFFLAPEGWVPPTNKTSKGIDIRGVGGFAMLPPSMHESGTNYAWIKSYEPWLIGIMEAPSWITEAVDELLSQFTKVERGERTESPAQAVDGFGMIVDGREDYMTRLIWGRVVSLYRECPFDPTDGHRAEMRDAWVIFDQNVKSRIFEPGTPNHILLEREGRGPTLFAQKWEQAIAQWDTKVKEAAALPAPEKKIESPQELQQDADLSDSPESIMDDVFEILDVMGIKSLPDPEWLINKIIMARSLGFIYGPPGAGKSFIALGIALCIAAGMAKWWDRDIKYVGPVVYISSEGVSDIKFRIRAWEIALGINADEIPFFLIHQTINFMKEEDTNKLLRTINKVVQLTGKMPVYVTVDTVSRVLPGADENLQKDMTLFIGACDEVKETFGASVAGVHHSSRQGNLRGSTVFDGAADFLLSVSREEGSEIGQLHAKKIKAAPDGWTQNFKLRKVDLGDIAGNSSLFAEPTDEEIPEEGKTGWPSKPICQDVLDAIGEAWNAGQPWSNHHLARKDGRYAMSHMKQRWEIDERIGSEMIEQWLTNKVIEVSIYDRGTKMRGLKVLQNLYDASSMPKKPWYQNND